MQIKPPSIFIVLFLLLSCNNREGSSKLHEIKQEFSSVITEVTTQTINRSIFKQEILSQGILYASITVDITSELIKEITVINVGNGKHVTKGDILIKLEDIDAQRELLKLRYSLEKTEREREKLLIAKLGYGFSTGDSTRIPGDVLKMVNMDVGYMEKLLEVQEKEAELQKHIIRAPVTGRVADLKAKELNRPPVDIICTILDDRIMEAAFPVLETHLIDLSIGDSVRITPLASGENFRGQIIEINPRVSAGGMIQVKARVPNWQGKLIDGMKCQVAVEKSIANQLVIPKSAMVMRDNRKVIFYYVDGQAYWQYVATPYENSDSYVITQENGEHLTEGKEVIITGNINLAHETEVQKRRIKLSW